MNTISARSLQAKRKRNGDIGETQAADLLRLLGATCVQRISTPWRIARNGFGKIVGASPVGKVTGDFTGLLPGGQGLLVEVKRREDGLLSWGDLEEHQHRSLHAFSVAGGAAWVILASPSTIMAMWYREMVAAGWSKGSPLHQSEAEGLRIRTPA